MSYNKSLINMNTLRSVLEKYRDLGLLCTDLAN